MMSAVMFSQGMLLSHKPSFYNCNKSEANEKSQHNQFGRSDDLDMPIANYVWYFCIHLP